MPATDIRSVRISDSFTPCEIISLDAAHSLSDTTDNRICSVPVFKHPKPAASEAERSIIRVKSGVLPSTGIAGPGYSGGVLYISFNTESKFIPRAFNSLHAIESSVFSIPSRICSEPVKALPKREANLSASERAASAAEVNLIGILKVSIRT